MCSTSISSGRNRLFRPRTRLWWLAESVMASAKLALEMRQTQLALADEVVRSGPTSMRPSNRSMTWRATYGVLRVMTTYRGRTMRWPVSDRGLQRRYSVNTDDKVCGSKYADVGTGHR